VSFLIDTDVLSELRKRVRDKGVDAWVRGTASGDIYLSVLSIGEARRGADQLRERGDSAQAKAIETWLYDVIKQLGDRIVPVTIDVAQVWGGRSVRRSAPIVDSLIAATALVRDLTVVTRNTKDFAPTGVRILNPFSA